MSPWPGFLQRPAVVQRMLDCCTNMLVWVLGHHVDFKEVSLYEKPYTTETMKQITMPNHRLQPDRGPFAVSAESERIRLGRGG
jgi:hypothetical protein